MRLVAPLATILFPALLTAQGLTPDQQLAHEIYKELIEINTADSVGSTTVAADAIAKRFLAAGFPASDIFQGGPRADKGNIVVRYHGSGVRKPMMLLAHLDVVAALKSDWSADLDPFKFIERDGYYYGRGTSDDKAMASLFIANLLRFKKEGYRPDRDIILVLTADEEGGGSNGVRWLLANHRDKIDAEFALNEGAGVALSGGKPLRIGIQTSEKVPVNYVLEVNNPGGHSSLPTRDNAIYRLAEGLVRLSKFEFPVRLNQTTRAWLERGSLLEEPQVAADMRSVASGELAGAAVERLSSKPAYNAQLRTTCVATMLEGGHAFNALPQAARATVNCRVLPGEPMEEVRSTLVRVLADQQISVTPTWTHVASAPSPLDPTILETVERVSAQFWPGVPVIPSMTSGATDGSFLRNAGIPTYGHSGLALEMTDVRFHGKDERIPVKSFYDGLEYQYRLVKALSSAR